MKGDTPLSPLTEEEAAAFVGSKKAEFYIGKWSNNRGDWLKGWNWATFFFGLEWMVYRKLYREAAILLLLANGLPILTIFLTALTGYRLYLASGWIVRGFQLVLCLIGNGLYYQKAVRTLAKTAGMASQEKTAYLREKGGTSIPALIILILVELVVAFSTN